MRMVVEEFCRGLLDVPGDLFWKGDGCHGAIGALARTDDDQPSTGYLLTLAWSDPAKTHLVRDATPAFLFYDQVNLHLIFEPQGRGILTGGVDPRQANRESGTRQDHGMPK
jgi:hypothetical protein